MTDKKSTQLIIIDYIVNYALLPLIVEEIASSTWAKSDLPFYLCRLYLKRRHAELSKALVNMYADPYLTKYMSKHISGYRQASDFDRLTTLNFNGYCHDPLYQHPLIAISTAVYYPIHAIRGNPILNSILQQPETALEPVLSYLSTRCSYIFKDPYIIGPIIEELTFRWFWQGILLKLPETLLHKFNIHGIDRPLQILRIILQALLFSAAHNNGQEADMCRFCAGIIYGVLYEKTGSLLPSIIAHSASNIYCDYINPSPRTEFSLDPELFKDFNLLAAITTPLFMLMFILISKLLIKYFLPLVQQYAGGASKVMQEDFMPEKRLRTSSVRPLLHSHRIQQDVQAHKEKEPLAPSRKNLNMCCVM